MNGGNNMKIRIIKKKLKRENNLLGILWLKHLQEWYKLSRNPKDMFPGITKHYIKCTKNKLK